LEVSEILRYLETLRKFAIVGAFWGLISPAHAGCVFLAITNFYVRNNPVQQFSTSKNVFHITKSAKAPIFQYAGWW